MATPQLIEQLKALATTIKAIDADAILRPSLGAVSLNTDFAPQLARVYRVRVSMALPQCMS